MPNWIDRLWGNPVDREAEKELRQLWLRFQADRKEAWEELSTLVTSSERLKRTVRAQIAGAARQMNQQIGHLDGLTQSALTEACMVLGKLRSRLPASTKGVFLPYLRATNDYGRYHWVQRVLSVHFPGLVLPGERERQLEEEDL